ncbi:MAG: AMP-binding protein, partial [Opitutaceae bacterium]
MSAWSHILGGEWLNNGEETRARFGEIARARCAELETFPEGGRVLLVDADPVACAAGIAAVFASELPVLLFLGSPQWGRSEWEAVAQDVAPHAIWGGANLPQIAKRAGDGDEGNATEPQLFIPTGGTTGGVKFARHTCETLAAAADGLRSWLGGGVLHSVCFLPLFHVSGLMQLVRGWRTGGMVTLASWREIEAGEVSAYPLPPDALTSIVPTQLARLLTVPGAAAWLRQFRGVFLGGATPWRELLDAARAERLPLAPCYGMTETAAQIVAMRPEDFLETGTLAGEVLPHACVELLADDANSTRSGEHTRLACRLGRPARGMFGET